MRGRREWRLQAPGPQQREPPGCRRPHEARPRRQHRRRRWRRRQRRQQRRQQRRRQRRHRPRLPAAVPPHSPGAADAATRGGHGTGLSAQAQAQAARRRHAGAGVVARTRVRRRCRTRAAAAAVRLSEHTSALTAAAGCQLWAHSSLSWPRSLVSTEPRALSRTEPALSSSSGREVDDAIGLWCCFRGRGGPQSKTLSECSLPDESVRSSCGSTAGGGTCSILRRCSAGSVTREAELAVLARIAATVRRASAARRGLASAAGPRASPLIASDRTSCDECIKDISSARGSTPSTELSGWALPGRAVVDAVLGSLVGSFDITAAERRIPRTCPGCTVRA